MTARLSANRSAPKVRTSHAKGKLAEASAEILLRTMGYSILARRYKTPSGEIDLVARRGVRVAFIEVKLRPTLDDAAESVTRRLRGRVRQAAELWLQDHEDDISLDPAFDVVLMAPGQWPVHMNDAFPFE
jgi:putative endonuclease